MQKSEVFHKTKCRLCNNKKLKPVYHLNPQPIGDDYIKNKNKKQKLYPLILNLCSKCNFVQLSHVINPKIVYGKLQLLGRARKSRIVSKSEVGTYLLYSSE